MPDGEDACPASDLRAMVILDDCDSEVINPVFPSGCTLADLLAQCADAARTHRQFVRCVGKLTNGMEKMGILTDQQQDALHRCAAQAALPLAKWVGHGPRIR